LSESLPEKTARQCQVSSAKVMTHWSKQYILGQVHHIAGDRYVSSSEAYLVNQMEDLQTDIDPFYLF